MNGGARNALALWLTCACLGVANGVVAARSTLTASDPVQKPDLAIERVAVDSHCAVLVTVVNRGPGRVPEAVWRERSRASSGVNLSVDGKSWGGEPIWRFDPGRKLQGPGGTTTFALGYRVEGTIAAAVTVDPTAQVAEANERNNTLTAALMCDATAARAPHAPAPSRGERLRPLGDETGPNAAVLDAEPPTASAPSARPSLLDTPLPPPPQNLPPAPEAEDPRVEPAEVVVASANMTEALALAQAAQGLGFGIRRRANLSGLGMVVTVLRVPPNTSVATALTILRQAVPTAWADANHRFTPQAADRTLTYGRMLVGWSDEATACGRGVRIGMIDTVLERDHPALKGREIVTRALLPAGIARAKPDHGTAVAALLVGNALASGFGGLAPAARLYAAEIFRAREENQTDTTAEWIVAALDWLAVQKVHIVNLSFGGPRNLILELAITRVLAHGVAVVAAGGNSGAQAPPVYPAAQSGVVAVTAVDAALAPYRKANHGEYIAFAAPGVDVWSAASGKNGAYYSGTSYAAPFVTAVLAVQRQVRPRATWPQLIRQAQTQARDLGEPGKDRIFGWGLVQATGCGRVEAQRR